MHAGETARPHAFLVFLTLILGYAGYGAVASIGMSFLFLILTAFLAAYQATLGRQCRPILRVLPAVCSVAVALSLSLSVEAVLLSLTAPVLGLVMGWAACRGYDRATLAASGMVVLFFLLLGIFVYRICLLSVSTGEADILLCMQKAMDGLRDSFAEFQREGMRFLAHFAEQSGVSYPLPADGALVQAASYMLSVMPGVILLVCGALGLVITYLMQLMAMAANDTRLFSRKNALYELSVIPAGLYLAAQLVLLFYNDPSSVVFWTCLNTVTLLCPVLAFAKCKEITRLFRFVKRFAVGRLDLAVWAVLTVMFVLFYLSYILPILAIWQAISILKSAFAASRSEGSR